MPNLPIAKPEVPTAELQTVETILRRKGNKVWTIGPDNTVFDAIKLMEEKEVGALVVLDDAQIAGLLSERDYARKIALKGRHSKDTKVSEIMSTPAVIVTPEWTVNECLRLINDRRARHLVVLSGGNLVGLVSVGDLVNATIQGLADTVEHLSAYISGEYKQGSTE